MNFFTKVENKEAVLIEDIGVMIEYKLQLINLNVEDQPKYENGQRIAVKSESILMEIMEVEKWLKNNINNL